MHKAKTSQNTDTSIRIRSSLFKIDLIFYPNNWTELYCNLHQQQHITCYHSKKIQMSEFDKIMARRRKSIDSGSIDENIAKLESPNKPTTSSSPSNELTQKLNRRRRLSEHSPQTKKEIEQQSKIIQQTQKSGEKNRRASFSKPNSQLEKKLEKRIAKEQFADSVASFSGASNLESAVETDIDKALKQKKLTKSNSKHFDSPSSELETKLRKRRLSMSGKPPSPPSPIPTPPKSIAVTQESKQKSNTSAPTSSSTQQKSTIKTSEKVTELTSTSNGSITKGIVFILVAGLLILVYLYLRA